MNIAMKSGVVVVLAMCMVTVAYSAAPVGKLRMDRSKLLIYAYDNINYKGRKPRTEQYIREMKEGGLDFVFGPATREELDLFYKHGIGVVLDEADITLGVEVRDEFAIVFFESFKAPGGLPVGSNPRVLTLLSVGIDSPVAAWQIMKRGSPTEFITFHSAPYTPPETIDKVRSLVRILNRFQRHGRLFIVNLAEFQKAVRDNCSERMRTVLYRRAMFRIAEAVARREDCRALVTGEALGQVASQTVVNMDTINRAVDMLVLRPLVGADKLETIAVAERIGTMKLSSVQVPDSCTVFAPSSPATAVPAAIALKEESKIPNYAGLLEKIVADLEIDA